MTPLNCSFAQPRVCKINMCNRQIEPNAKWPLLTLARLKEAQSQLLSGTTNSPAAPDPSQPSAGAASAGKSGTAAAAGSQPEGPGSGPLSEARSIYGQLADIDPMRNGYYEDAQAGRAHVVLNPERVV